eukprot:gene9414-biopygen1579
MWSSDISRANNNFDAMVEVKGRGTAGVRFQFPCLGLPLFFAKKEHQRGKASMVLGSVPVAVSKGVFSFNEGIRWVASPHPPPLSGLSQGEREGERAGVRFPSPSLGLPLFFAKKEHQRSKFSMVLRSVPVSVSKGVFSSNEGIRWVASPIH